MPNTLGILYANGQVQAVQLYVWDGTKPILWDGSTTGGSHGFNIPACNEVDLTQPDATHDVYTYKLSSVVVGTITITYTDSTHNTMVSAILT